MALPYSEGTVFLVPLDGGGYARGVVARMAPRGKVLLGYFFGPRLSDHDSVSFDDIDPSQAILRVRFGDLGLFNGEWPIRGKIAGWDRTKWGMPDVVRRDITSDRAWLVRYSDDNPNQVVAEYPIDFDVELPTDFSCGYLSVALKLNKLLPGGCETTRADAQSVPSQLTKEHGVYPIHHYLYFLDKQDGRRVADILRNQDFVVDFELGADDVKWLVLAKSDATPTSETIEEQGQYLQQIAEENGGEYDGWEAEGMHV